MENFKLLGKLNVLPAVEEIVRQPWLWDEITARQDLEGSPHHDTRAIYLRWCKDQSPEAAFKVNQTIYYPAAEMLSATVKLARKVVDVANGRRWARVMVVALRKNGGAIDPHIDEGEYADVYSRFHLPLVTDEGCQFYGGTSPGCGEFVHMRRGEVWWFNHKRPHWVFNGSPYNRVHLIVDCIAPDHWVERG